MYSDQLHLPKGVRIRYLTTRDMSELIPVTLGDCPCDFFPTASRHFENVFFFQMYFFDSSFHKILEAEEHLHIQLLLEGLNSLPFQWSSSSTKYSYTSYTLSAFHPFMTNFGMQRDQQASEISSLSIINIVIYLIVRSSC